MYWVCYGLFSVVDQFAGFILSFIPFYHLLKLVFLVYLYHPKSDGALKLYENVIKPEIFDKVEKLREDKYKDSDKKDDKDDKAAPK